MVAILHHSNLAVRRRHTLGIAASLVAISAHGGALGLASGGLSLGEKVTARLPFHSPVFGGIALAMIVGVPFTVLWLWAWRGDRRTDLAAVLAGMALLGWLVIELAFIREFSYFHVIYAVIGVAFAVSGRAGARRRPTDRVAAAQE